MSRHLPGLALVVAALAACDRDFPNPAAGPALRILASDPEPQQAHVPRQKALRFRVSRLVRSTSVIRQSILVTPGTTDAETGAIPAGVVFFEPRWDPYDRVVTFELSPGDRWIPSTLYSVTLLLPNDPSSIPGLRALDGTPLEAPVSFEFMSGESVSDPQLDVDDTWPAVDFCQGAPDRGLPAVRDVFRSSCAAAGCHGWSAGAGPMMGLDLATSDGILSTAIRVTARQTLRGPGGGAPDPNPPTFGDSMPRIDPGNPGNSYVFYKLLINAGSYPDDLQGTPAAGPWLGDLPADATVPLDEIERMRELIVQGSPMPTQGSLRPDAMRAVMTWIAQGAELKDCPPVR